MDNCTLPPNDTNIRDTLIKDPVGRNEYIAGIIKLLKNLKGSAIITLEGTWGSGKTFFVKQLEMICNDQSCWENFSQKCKQIIEVLPVLNEDPIKVLYYDAWENDGSTNPLLNLVYNLSIMSGISIDHKQFSLDHEELLTQVINMGKNISPMFEVIDFIRRVVTTEETSESEIMNIINKEKNQDDILESFIEKIKEENEGNRVVIIIDELDRCRPEFALKLIESIKHYFHKEGIIVILALNPIETNSIIKKYYGNEFDANGYIDKIVDMRIQLPTISIDEYLSYIFSKNITNAVIPRVIKMIIEKYKLSMRQINRYIGALRAFMPEDIMSGYSINMHYFPDDYVGFFVYSYLVPYLIGVRIFNIDDYKTIKNGMGAKIFESDYMSLGNGSSVFKLHNIISNEENKPIDTITKQEIEAINKIYTYGFSADYIMDEFGYKVNKYIQNAVSLTESLNIINLR